MSSRIPGKKNGGIVRRSDQGSKPFEITVAIKNKTTKKWETARLDERDSLAIERAIASIRLGSERRGLRFGEVFNEDDAFLEMTDEGIFVKEGHVWKDLLSDMTVQGATRGVIRRTLRVVTNILGKKENNDEASEEVALNAQGLPQGDVVIQVRVLPKPSPLLPQVTQDVTDSAEKENAFNQKIAEALIAFENPVFSEDLLAHGWNNDEIQEHQKALEDLKFQSDQVLKILDNTLLKLSEGKLSEAISDLCAHMQEHYPAYVRACSALVIPQKVAKGRSLIEQRPPFMLSLEHVMSHSDSLDKLLSEINQEADPKLKKMAQEGKWSEALNEMQSEAEKLQKALTFTPMVMSLNYNHQLNQEFTKRINTFVESYQKNRAQFDKVMNEHKITDLQSAFIFNHYVSFADVLNQWNGRIQTVVDLANKKEYEASIEEYTDVMGDLHAPLTAQVRNVYFTLQTLKDPAVQAAFKAFAARVGLFNPSQILADLETERAAIKQQLMYTEGVEKAQKAGIPLPDRVGQTLQETKERISSEEMALPTFTRLFETSSNFVHVFTFGGLMLSSHPLHKVWSPILLQYRWKLDNIEKFTNLMNEYATFIRPFKQAEQGIATETDPARKEELRQQLRVLAQTQLPKLNALQKQLESLGGMGQLQTVVEAAVDFAAAPQLQTPKRQVAARKLLSEAQSQVKLMEDRLAYINQIYNDFSQA